MKISISHHPMKRKLIKTLAMLPWATACSVMAAGSSSDDSQKRFNGIGITLVVDAVPGTDMKGVVFYDERSSIIYAKSRVSRRNREIMALGSTRVPLTVRAVWRDNPKAVWGGGGIIYEGPIAGDYTIPVAERIPDEVLNEIRAHGGGLRLKFRLKPDGVLFGWDIIRDGAGTGYTFKYEMPGGDFLETRY